MRSAVRLAAQNSEAAQSALAEQLQLIASSLDQSRDAGGGFSDRVAAIEQALDAQNQRLAEAQAVYSAELAEVHEALMKIGANHQTLAGAIDNWRSNNSGEIHLINARIGAVHEDGGKRLAAIEKLCADVETLSHLVLDDRTRQQGSFKRWLLGTEDWVKASWRPPAIPRPIDFSAEMDARLLAAAVQQTAQRHRHQRLEQLAGIEDAVADRAPP